MRRASSNSLLRRFPTRRETPAKNDLSQKKHVSTFSARVLPKVSVQQQQIAHLQKKLLKKHKFVNPAFANNLHRVQSIIKALQPASRHDKAVQKSDDEELPSTGPVPLSTHVIIPGDWEYTRLYKEQLLDCQRKKASKPKERPSEQGSIGSFNDLNAIVGPNGTVSASHAQKQHTLCWKQQTSALSSPETRYGACLAVHGHKLFLIGGQCRGRPTEIKVLNMLTRKWRDFPVKLQTGRVGHSAVFYKDSLILFGGYTRYDNLTDSRICGGRLEVLDIKRMSWNVLNGYGDKPSPRRNHAACILGQFFIVYGGEDARSKALAGLHFLDLQTYTWSQIASTPGARSGATLTPVFPPEALADPDLKKLVKASRTPHFGLYLFGGINTEALDDLWILRFLPHSFEWVKATPQGRAPLARHGHSAVYINDLYMLLGGRNDLRSSEPLNLDVLIVSEQQWTSLAVTGVGPSPCWGHAATVYNENMLVFGGMDYTSLKPAEIFTLYTNPLHVNVLLENEPFEEMPPARSRRATRSRTVK